jgi:hypothetical protein
MGMSPGESLSHEIGSQTLGSPREAACVLPNLEVLRTGISKPYGCAAL